MSMIEMGLWAATGITVAVGLAAVVWSVIDTHRLPAGCIMGGKCDYRLFRFPGEVIGRSVCIRCGE